jgi:hypothetical protein
MLKPKLFFVALLLICSKKTGSLATFALNQTNNELDTDIFGDCIIHVKRFRENQFTVDFAGRVIEANPHHLLTTHDPYANLTYTNLIGDVLPIFKANELCTLHIIIGVSNDDHQELYNLVDSNPFAFASAPTIRYIFVPLDYADFIKGSKLGSLFLEIPAGIFIFDNSASEYYYLCSRCSVYKSPVGGFARPQRVEKDHSIALVSDTQFKQYWRTAFFNSY